VDFDVSHWPQCEDYKFPVISVPAPRLGAIPGRMEPYPCRRKKIASGDAKIPCPSGTGNLLKTIAPER
jgi:hypothetical protein